MKVRNFGELPTAPKICNYAEPRRGGDRYARSSGGDFTVTVTVPVGAGLPMPTGLSRTRQRGGDKNGNTVIAEMGQTHYSDDHRLSSATKSGLQSLLNQKTDELEMGRLTLPE